MVLGVVLALIGGEPGVLANRLANINPYLDMLITSVLFALLYFLSEVIFKGRSIGKFITKTKVVDPYGNTPSLMGTFTRSASRLIPFNGLSFPMGARGWYDALSKTYVVDVYEFEKKKRLFGEFNQIGAGIGR
ncbi:RDD family protein [Zhouia amylolytica]|uniref:RDD family protein n=1 Tax=Zhouia amylolytica TaxID=376730 RepID=A0A1I6PF63_9FLAO|nr:RDD family protein [Zhouia amylolytica]